MESRSCIESSGAPVARARAGALLFLPLLGLAIGAAPGAAQADLVVTFDPVPTAAFVLGQQAEVGVTVRNRGNRATPDGECVKVHLRATNNSFAVMTANGFLGDFCGDSLDGANQTGQCRIGRTSSGWCKVKAIPANGSRGFRFVVRPASLGGNAMVLTVDPDNRIRESNDRNNVQAIPVRVRSGMDEQELSAVSTGDAARETPVTLRVPELPSPRSSRTGR
jgi:CARDB